MFTVVCAATNIKNGLGITHCVTLDSWINITESVHLKWTFNENLKRNTFVFIIYIALRRVLALKFRTKIKRIFGNLKDPGQRCFSIKILRIWIFNYTQSLNEVKLIEYDIFLTIYGFILIDAVYRVFTHAVEIQTRN